MFKIKPLFFLFFISSAAGFFCSFVFSAQTPAENPYPERIICLAPSATKSLYLLGEEDRIIAVTLFCPEEASGKEKIGTILEPSIEKIVSLSPGLVIASKEGNKRQTVKTLKKLGIKVFSMESYNSFQDICDGFISLGKILGKEKIAEEIVSKAKERIVRIQTEIEKKETIGVFWEVGAQPLFTISKKSFVNEFIELAGGHNIFSDLKVRYAQVSIEEVLRRDPDVIMLITMGDVTDKEIRSWSKFKEMKAVKSGRIYVLNSGVFTDPTPLAIADGVEIVANLLHGVPLRSDNRHQSTFKKELKRTNNE